MTLAEFSGTSGEVLTFKVKLGTVPGNYNLNLGNATIANAQSQNILTAVINGIITIQTPDIHITPTSIDYGRVPLLQTSDRSFTVQNTGNADLTISNISSDFSDFEVLGSSSFTLTPGNSQSVTIRFHSNTKGTYNKQITIMSDDPDESIRTIALSVIAYAVNEFDINDMFGRSGHEAELTIDISNMEEFVGFSFDLDIPEVLTLVPGSAELTDRKNGHVVSATTLSNGNIRIVAYSANNDPFTGNSDDVLTLDFLIDGRGGYYTLNFINPVIGDAKGNNIISDDYSGTLEIAAPDISVSPSSLNFGDVSVFDTLIQNATVYNYGSDTLNISSLIFYDTHFFTDRSLPVILAPGENTHISVSFHDDSEGTLNSSMRIRSNDPDEDPLDISLSATSFIPNIMRVDSTSISWNDTGSVSVSIENNEPFVGFQFDLIIPEGLNYSDEVNATGRLSNHVLNAQLNDGNVLTVFAYSPSQAEIIGNSGAVIDILFKADSDHDSYQLNLDNVTIGNSNSENIVSSWEGTTLSVVQNMSIGLNPGWNLVSWNVDTWNDSIETLFSDVMDDIEIVLGFEIAGLTYDPDLPQFSTLKQCDHLHGYWLKMNSVVQYHLNGLYIKENTPIHLNAGWNLVSFLPNSVLDIETALGNIMDKVIVVLGYNKGGLTYDPDLPQFSTLNILTPGYGYWIKVGEECTLIYPDI